MLSGVGRCSQSWEKGTEYYPEIYAGNFRTVLLNLRDVPVPAILPLIANLMRYVIYSYFEKVCRKKCTRQSCKALWVVLSFFFQRNLKEFARKAMEMCLQVLKESNRSRFDSYSRQEQCIDHIPYYLLGLSGAHFSRQPFSK